MFRDAVSTEALDDILNELAEGLKVRKLIKSRKLYLMLSLLTFILLISSCEEFKKEKFVEADEPESNHGNQINEIIEVGNTEVIKFTSNIGNKYVFEYMNLQNTYDLESSIDFFVNGNKQKFASILYGVNDNGEIYYAIEELPEKQLQLSVINGTGIIPEIDTMNLTKTIYYNKTEQKFIEDTELILGVIVYSAKEKSAQQMNDIIEGSLSMEEVIQKEDYVFILKTKFKISDNKK